MNISEVKSLVAGASYEEKLAVLETICKRTGDCLENGYLGSSVTNISYDEFEHVEFESENLTNNTTTQSCGTVLDESVVIMQTQELKDNKLYQLYSWNLEGTSYTYFAFDSKAALEKAYTAIKKANKGFLAKNLDNDLQELGIAYRDIMNVKVAVKVQQVQTHEEEVVQTTCNELLTSF